MARGSDALNQLQDQIESIRREAHSEGYAAAMQAVREYTSRSAGPQAGTGTGRRRGRPSKAEAKATGAAPVQYSPKRSARTARKRPERGRNAELIQEILQQIVPRAAKPSEIRKALERDKKVSVAFTSIRHALGQLEARKAVQQTEDGWRATPK